MTPPPDSPTRLPRFLIDVNFDQRIIKGLRRLLPEADVVTAQELGLREAPDPELLKEAQALDRIVLTHDVTTMRKHFSALLAQLREGEHSPGVLLVAQDLDVGLAIQELYEFAPCSSHEEWRDTFTFLPL